MVGARYAHKNVDEVLDQAAHWRERWVLKVTSCGGAYRQHLERRVNNEGLAGRVVFLDYLDASQLLALYQQCDALLYPSKWEGFGIPPLEALACGAPVIASDIPVHREVLGDAVTRVPLGDGDAWQRAFERLAAAPRGSREVTPAARKVLDRYTWANSARQLEEALLAVEPALASRLRKPILQEAMT
jgi:glycosyltransferase involved in cell wall biosynthesis